LKNDVAAWFIDHDYDEESFFVRQAILGDDPYEGLKRALKAEIDETAWAELNSTVSQTFPQPQAGPHLRQGDQPLRRWGPEGIFGEQWKLATETSRLGSAEFEAGSCGCQDNSALKREKFAALINAAALRPDAPASLENAAS